MWLNQSLMAFREALLNLSQPNRPTAHAPLERVPGATQKPETPTANSPMRKHVLDNLAKLMIACVVLRIEDFTVYRVTTSGKKQMPKEFVAGKVD